MTTPDTAWLLGYPVQLGMSTVEHIEDWMREFSLMALSRAEGTAGHTPPARLQAMVEVLTRRYSTELSAADRLRTAAAARGDAAVDLPYPLRPETETVIEGWRRMLDEVDAYCQAEELLTLQRTPEQVRLQNWICDEFVRQWHGEPPRPWAAVRPVPDLPTDGPSGGEDAPVGTG